MRAPSRLRRSAGRGALALALPALLLASAAPADAVVFGRSTPVSATPWAVQLTGAGGAFCTGSLIRPTVVLTAAHCVVGGGRITVVLNRRTTAGAGGIRVRAVRRAYYRRYVGRAARRADGVAVASDVGLLQLARPVSEIAPVALGSPEDGALLAAGRRLTVSGWGLSSNRLTPAARGLRTTSMPVRPKRWCDRRLRSDSEGALCVGQLARPVPGPCFGDSGGPLYVRTPAGAIQLGVVSGGGQQRCGREPAYFARVQDSDARRWIDGRITADGQVTGGAKVR